MISCYFHGDTGNNIFQLAATLAHAEKYNTQIELLGWRDFPVPNSPFQIHKLFNYDFKFLPQLKSNYSQYHHDDLPLTPASRFQYTPIPFTEHVALRGYFQSEKYFENIKTKIKEEYFRPHSSIIESLESKWLNKYDFKNSVAMHVRAADRPRDIFINCPNQYYVDAMNKILENDTNISNIFCFSDNIEWCKNNIVSDDVIFVENNTVSEDIVLMSLCKHNIIGNSTFSWWSAYLNLNPTKIVVAPKTWWFGPGYNYLNLDDLFPSEWITL